MTSKAERKRRKHAQRKLCPNAPHAKAMTQSEASPHDRQPPGSKRREKATHHFIMTPKQTSAWEWFFRLENDASPEARSQIRAIRQELTLEEFAALAESTRSMYPHRRIGHSGIVTRDLKMSALRKLVIYCGMNNLNEEIPTAEA
jgi:hypothetical protein